MKALHTVFVGIWIALSGVGTPAAEPSPEARFSKAADLMNAGHFAEALPILEGLAQTHPTANVFWNLGLAAAEVGANEKALASWQELRSVSPDDWRARAKLIQTYQVLGNLASRDAERTQLLALWKSGSNPRLSSEKLYCREQIQIGDREVFAFEYFEPSGEYMVIYSFTVASGPGAGTLKVSLGSYESTNQIAWELGERPRDKRLYHLDLYDEGKHQTYGFYDELPSYDVVREQAFKVYSGLAAPLSQTTPGG